MKEELSKLVELSKELDAKGVSYEDLIIMALAKMISNSFDVPIERTIVMGADRVDDIKGEISEYFENDDEVMDLKLEQDEEDVEVSFTVEDDDIEEGGFVKPDCQLSGKDGNVFNIIGIVSKTLKLAGYNDKAVEFIERATSSESYDDVLRLCFEYVKVS